MKSMDKGTIVLIDYEAWALGAAGGKDELIDTSRKAVAEANSLPAEEREFTPMPTVVGAGRWFGPVEKSLSEAVVGKEYEVAIEPQDAYGERNEKNIEVHSLSEVMRAPEFKKGDTMPGPGMPVTLRNRTGTILRMAAGRVRVDFNPRYAGRRLKYRYTVISAAKDLKEKAEHILAMNYPSAGFTISVSGTDVTVAAPSSAALDLRWFAVKKRFTDELREHCGAGVVRITEEYAPSQTASDASRRGAASGDAAPPPPAAEPAAAAPAPAPAEKKVEKKTGAGSGSVKQEKHEDHAHAHQHPHPHE